MVWAKTTVRWDEKYLILGIWCGLYKKSDSKSLELPTSRVLVIGSFHSWFFHCNSNWIDFFLFSSKFQYSDSCKILHMMSSAKNCSSLMTKHWISLKSESSTLTGNSRTLAMELLQSCTKPLSCYFKILAHTSTQTIWWRCCCRWKLNSQLSDSVYCVGASRFWRSYAETCYCFLNQGPGHP